MARMRRAIGVLLVLCTLFSLSAWAAPISLQEAEALANKHWRSVTPLRGEGRLALLYTSTGLPLRGETDSKDYYIFGNRSGVGFVVVAGDDALPAVLGYSTQSRFEPSALSSELKAWLAGYALWVQQVRKGTVPPSEQLLRAPNAAVEPLLGSLIWGQGWPYNNKTPGLTGCVATAITQIMRYYAWPKQGRGVVKFKESEQTLDLSTHTYSWDKMLNSYTSSATPEQQDAVATLMHDFGRAAQMNYSGGGSGATSINAFTALIRNFDYSKTLRRVEQIHYSFRDWQALLLSELQAKRPVYYSGNTYNNQPHAFVCDGYDGKGYFHFNWGGNGASDGFFALNALNIQELNHTNNSNPGYSFSVSDMIIGIQPSVSAPLDEYPLNFTCARFEVKEGTYSKAESVECTVRGLENAAYPTLTLTAGVRVLDATGKTIREVASTDVPEKLVSGQIIHVTKIRLAWADLPKGTYTVAPLAYIPEGKTFHTARLNWRSPVFALTVDDNQLVVKEVTPQPILEMEWLPKRMYGGVSNHCTLRVKNVGTRDYNAIVMALFTKSADEPSLANLRYSDITYRATIRVSPGEVEEYRFDAFGPLSGAKYVHFFYDKKNNEGGVERLTPGSGSGIVSPQYYPKDWGGVQEVALVDSYSFGEVLSKQGQQPSTIHQNDYLTSRFEFSVKDPTKGARLWLKVYLRQGNETKSSFDAGTVNLLPGERQNVSIPQIIKLAPGDYEYALSLSIPVNGKWQHLRYEKFTFTVLEGTGQLPIPPYAQPQPKPKYTVHAPVVEKAEGGSCTMTRLDGQELRYGAQVEEGTLLKIDIVRNTGWVVEKKELKGVTLVEGSTYKVTGEVRVSVTFAKETTPNPPVTQGYKYLGLTQEGKGEVRVMSEMRVVAPNESIEKGKKITVVATPEEGWEALPQNITVSPATQDGSEWLPTGDFTVNVTFTKKENPTPEATYLFLGANITGQGTVKVQCNGKDLQPQGTIKRGEKITVVVVPNDGWEALPQNITVSPATQERSEWLPTGDFTVNVTFTKKENPTPEATYLFLGANITGQGTVKVQCNGKDLQPQGTIKRGEKITVVVVPSDGWEAFPANLHVTASEKISDYEWLPKGAFAVAMLFVKKVPKMYDVTLAEVQNGYITVSKSKASENDVVKLTVTPDADYHLKEGSLLVYKTGDRGVVIPVNDRQFTMPAHPVTVTAVFEKNQGSEPHKGRNSKNPNAVEDAALASLSVAPNPFTTQLRLVNPEGVVGRYEVVNLMGAVLRAGATDTSETIINTEALPTGLYILRLTTTDGATKALRVVKQ